MKSLNFIFAALFLLLTISFTSCGDTTSSTESSKQDSIKAVESSTNKSSEVTPISKLDSTASEESPETLGIEHTAKYICPNHCKGSGSDKAGVCKNSECGMELMENPNYKENNM